jgi:hypothetical protein
MGCSALEVWVDFFNSLMHCLAKRPPKNLFGVLQLAVRAVSKKLPKPPMQCWTSHLIYNQDYITFKNHHCLLI